jgi:hypothetical protein
MLDFLHQIPEQVWLYLFSAFTSFLCLQTILNEKWKLRGAWDKAFWILLFIMNTTSMVYMYWHLPS